MFLFSSSVTPAVRTHLNAQATFLNEMSQSLSRSFQDLCQLNMQLGQTLLEEGTLIGHQLLTIERPEEALSVTAARAQPAAEKLRAYQQHVSRVAADSQVEVARVAEQHVPETARTARALADEVARNAAAESERTLRKQEETLKNFRDPFENSGRDEAYRGGMNGAKGSAGSHGHLHMENDHAPFQGSMQSAQGTQAGQATGKAGKSA